MAKRKLKLKFVKFILFILFLVLIYVIYFNVIGDNIKSININGNHYLKDSEIIELAGIGDYKDFLKKSSSSIEKKLTKNILIEKAKVKKKINKSIIITITEKKILFRNSNTDKYVLSDEKEYALDKTYNVPLLINYVPDEVYKDFVNKYKELDLIIIDKISEIKYSPNQYDDDLFMFYMNDKNLVQVTVAKLKNLNKYNEIVTKLNGKNGILYLDSGNYFKIME